MNTLKVTHIIPDYSKSNKKLWKEVCSLAGFNQYCLAPEILKKAPRLNFKSVELALVKPGIDIGAGKVMYQLEKAKLSEIDFPTYCEAAKQNPDYFRQNFVAFEWGSCFAICSQGDLIVNTHPSIWGGGWEFLGASKIST